MAELPYPVDYAQARLKEDPSLAEHYVNLRTLDKRVKGSKSVVLHGDDVTTSFTITHNFGTKSIALCVWEIGKNGDPDELVITDVGIPDVDRLVISTGSYATPTGTDYRVDMVAFSSS